MIETDERLGLPSASAYEQMLLCRGSWQMQKGLPEVRDAGDDDAAASGDRIHAYLGATDQAEVARLGALLEGDEMETAQACTRRMADATDYWLKNICEHDGVEPSAFEREERLFLHHGLTPIASGKPDRLEVRGSWALVLDYKTGWKSKNVTPSGRNPQLWALAVMVRANFPHVDHVTVGIVPGRGSAPVELAQFNVSALMALESNYRADLKDAEMVPLSAQTLTAGDKQCKYCRAKAHCKAAQELVGNMASLTIGTGEVERRELLSNEMLSSLLDKCGAVDRMVGHIRAEAKRRLGAGETIKGWALTEGRSRREITDASQAFSALAAEWDVTPAEFTSACKVAVSKLDTLVRNKSGMKVLDAKQALERVLTAAGCFEKKMSAPELERVETIVALPDALPVGKVAA